ncbi:MAG: hypothetical protein ACOVNS_01325 [Erythrobacter sp.]
MLFAIFLVLVGAISLWSVLRGEEYSSTTLYVSERSPKNVMECLSGKSGQIKGDLKPIGACRSGSVGRTACQSGMTYLSTDGQMRLTVLPSDGAVEIRVRHNQPLSASAIENLEWCAK